MKRCFKQAGQPHLWQTRFRPYETPFFFAGKRGRLSTCHRKHWMSCKFPELFAYAFWLGNFPQISCKWLFFGPQKMLRHFWKERGLQMVASLKWTSWSCNMLIFCKSIWFFGFWFLDLSSIPWFFWQKLNCQVVTPAIHHDPQLWYTTEWSWTSLRDLAPAHGASLTFVDPRGMFLLGIKVHIQDTHTYLLYGRKCFQRMGCFFENVWGGIMWRYVHIHVFQ